MGNNGKTMLEELAASQKKGGPRTTIGIKISTKERLDKNKAPGQCYEGFICQMIDLWEKTETTGG